MRLDASGFCFLHTKDTIDILTFVRNYTGLEYKLEVILLDLFLGYNCSRLGVWNTPAL